MNSKSWYQSKTVWFNTLTIVLVVAGFLGYTPDQQLTEQVSGALLALGPVINIILRLMTKTPIS